MITCHVTYLADIAYGSFFLFGSPVHEKTGVGVDQITFFNLYTP